MLRLLVLVAALTMASPVCAQGLASSAEIPNSPYTIDEYVEARRPVMQPRPLTGEEKTQARKLVEEISAILKKNGRPPHVLMEQLAQFAVTGDKAAIKAMMLGYAAADQVRPWPADATSITAWNPNMMLAGLWAIKSWEAGDRSKDASKAIDNCWRKNTPLVGMCGFTIKVDEDFRNPFNDHWAHNKGAPKNASFTEHTLTPPSEDQKERFDKFVAKVRAGDSYTAWDYAWAEVWAKRSGGNYPLLLQTAQTEGSRNYSSREAAKVANAREERDKQIKLWTELQAKRLELNKAGGELDKDEYAKWYFASVDLGGKYLEPYASKVYLNDQVLISKLCNQNNSVICQRQQQIYERIRSEAQREFDMKDARWRAAVEDNSPGSTRVRTYDQNGNYQGEASMPKWQADILAGH